jgi:putative tail protein
MLSLNIGRLLSNLRAALPARELKHASPMPPLIALDRGQRPHWSPRSYHAFAREGSCVEQAADKPLFTLCRRQETELPNAIKLGYVESARDYRQAAVESRRSTGASRRETVISLPVMLNQAAAQAAADRLLFETWTARETASLVLPPSHLALEPGDVVTLVQEGGPLELRIDEISEGHSRSIKATQIDAELYGLHAGALRRGSIAAAAALGEPLALFMELPQLTSSAEPYGLWAAACAEPWSGGLALYRRSGTRFELNRRITAPATMGETLDPLPCGPPGRRQHAAKLRLRLHHGALQSISEEDLLNGGNLAAIGSRELGYELIQFETATLIAPSTYEIASLLRGQLGSAPEILDSRPRGASFVRLNEAATQLAMRSADLGLAIDWRIGPSSRNLGDGAYREETTSLSGLALRPLAPCQLRARRSRDDVLFTWIRQTRAAGGCWPVSSRSPRHSAAFSPTCSMSF